MWPAKSLRPLTQKHCFEKNLQREKNFILKEFHTVNSDLQFNPLRLPCVLHLHEKIIVLQGH